jgi:triphosphoribosyl-dephospho-CoA synthase
MNDVARDVETACVWEATARKAGNVHPGADFDNLAYSDFVRSAAAIVPALAEADAPLGISILDAIRATRQVVRTNTNLGIVLLLAPLCRCRPGDWRAQLSAILTATTVADAESVYEAIRLAVPGGLGQVENQDISDKPTLTLRAVMALAADRDLIARQYANGYREVLDDGVPALLEGWARFGQVEAAILHLQVHLLSRHPDSLIVRKCGAEVAAEVVRRAQAIDLSTAAGRQGFVGFDRWLRENGHTRNPGTTADLVTACLFVALRENKMKLSMPFPWLDLEPSAAAHE